MSAGPLLEQPLSEVTEGIYTYAVAHFVFAKAVLPLLKDSPDSSYIIITGAGGEQHSCKRSVHVKHVMSHTLAPAPVDLSWRGTATNPPSDLAHCHTHGCCPFSGRAVLLCRPAGPYAGHWTDDAGHRRAVWHQHGAADGDERQGISCE